MKAEAGGRGTRENRKREAGREAMEKKGGWRRDRGGGVRRLCKVFVMGRCLSGTGLGVGILHGN